MERLRRKIETGLELKLIVPSLMWKALSIYFTIFQKIWIVYPIHWDGQRFEFTKLSSQAKQRRLFYFSTATLCSTPVLMLAHFVLMLMSRSVREDADLQTHQIMVMLYILAATFLGAISNVTTAWKWQQFVEYFVEVKKGVGRVEAQFKYITQQISITDIFTVFGMLAMIPALCLTIPSIATFSIHENVDPFYPWIKMIFKDHVDSALFRIVRAVQCLIIITEAWRHITHWCYIAYITLGIRNNSLLIMSKNLRSRTSFPCIHKEYLCQRILNTVDNDFFILFVPGILGNGAGIISLCSFASISLYSKLSLPYFFVMLCVAIASSAVALTLLPVGIHPYENSKALMFFWKWRIRTKYEKKLIRSCRFLRVQVGSVFHLKHSTQRIFWSMVITSTVNMILGIPI